MLNYTRMQSVTHILCICKYFRRFTQLCVCFTDVGKNLAPGGTATQSSEINNAVYASTAELAIQGNADDHFERNSCSHTDKQYEPWWKVTFKYDIIVSEVLIVNRDTSGKVLVNVLFSNFFPVTGWPAVYSLNSMYQFKVI